MKRFLYILIMIPILTFAQEDTISIDNGELINVSTREGLDSIQIDYLTYKNPMRASLYSSIAPGLGQIYNGKWWKAPIVWGLLGTGTGFIVYYNNQYREYRGYYLDKLYGIPIPEPGIDNLPLETLANLQDDRKRSRDYAIALTALAYLLNILDATVDAHLYGINKDPDLSFQPIIMQDYQTYQPTLGMGLNYKF